MSFSRESASRIGKEATPFDTGHHLGLKTTENEFLKSAYSTEELLRMKHLFRKKSHVPFRDPIRQHNEPPPKSTNFNRCEGNPSSNTVYFDGEFKTTQNTRKVGWAESSSQLKRQEQHAIDKDLNLNEMSQKYFSKRMYNDGSGGIYKREAGGKYMKAPREFTATGRVSSRSSASRSKRRHKDKKEVTQFLSTFSPTCYQYQRMAGGNLKSELRAQKLLKQKGILGPKQANKSFNLSQSMKELEIDPCTLGMDRLGMNMTFNLGDGSSTYAEQQQPDESGMTISSSSKKQQRSTARGKGGNTQLQKSTKELLHTCGPSSVSRMAVGWGGSVGAGNNPFELRSSRSSNQLSSARINQPSSSSSSSRRASNQISDTDNRNTGVQSTSRGTSGKGSGSADMDTKMQTLLSRRAEIWAELGHLDASLKNEVET